MNNCEHIKAQLLDLDVLKPIQDPQLADHLDQCPTCAAYLVDLQAMQEQLDHLPEHDVSDDVFAKTLAAVRQAAQETPAKPRRINPQWATGLAACFVLVAVVGLVYNNQLDQFQGDFSDAPMASETEAALAADAGPDAKHKAAPAKDFMPEEADTIDVEFIDPAELSSEIKKQMRVQNLQQSVSNAPAVSNTLQQIEPPKLELELEGNFAAPEPGLTTEEPAPLPDVLQEAIDESTAIVETLPVSSPVVVPEAFNERVREASENRAEKNQQNQAVLGQVAGGQRVEDRPGSTEMKPEMSLDQLLSAVQKGAEDKAYGGAAEANFKSKPKPASPPVDGLLDAEPGRQQASGESRDRRLNKAVAAPKQALERGAKKERAKADHQAAPVSVDQDDSTVGGIADKITVTGSRIKRSDVAEAEAFDEALDDAVDEFVSGYDSDVDQATETSPALQYFQQWNQTEGLTFQQATGYWANTYVPGDAHMRWLQARLQQSGVADLPAVRQNHQPFDPPRNAALALYLASDRSALNSTAATRMRLQVGLQAGEQQGGHRSALNLAVVLDLGSDPVSTDVRAEIKALLAALLSSKQVSDQVTVFVTGADGETGEPLIPADHFKHGPIQVALAELFAEQVDSNKHSGSLAASLESAYSWLQNADDPSAVLGSSAVWLVSTEDRSAQAPTLAQRVHQQATDGITLSTVALGDDAQRSWMQTLALQGQGHSRVMANAQDAARVVNDGLLAAAKAVARALRLQIRLAEGVQLIDVLGSYPLNQQQSAQVRAAEQSLDQRMARNLSIAADRGEDEDGIQMVIPSFYAGDTHVLLLDVLVPAGGSQAQAIAEVNLKYKDLIHLRNARSSQSLELSPGSHQWTPLSLNVLKNSLARQVAEQLDQAAGQLRAGQTSTAQQHLRELLQLLQSMRQHIPALKDDAELQQDEQLIQYYWQQLQGHSAIDPKHQQWIADAMQFNGWRRLQAHGP